MAHYACRSSALTASDLLVFVGINDGQTIKFDFRHHEYFLVPAMGLAAAVLICVPGGAAPAASEGVQNFWPAPRVTALDRVATAVVWAAAIVWAGSVIWPGTV